MCRTTARSWSSASGTSSGTGAWCCTARSARPCTARGRWPSARGWTSAGAWMRAHRPRTTASCCACPPRTRSPPGRSCSSSSRRSSSRSSPRRWAVPRCSPPGSGRTPRAPCCCRAPIPASARPCGSSASARPSCWTWPGSTRSSPSSWRRCASASRTCTTSPPCSSCSGTWPGGSCGWWRPPRTPPRPSRAPCCSDTWRSSSTRATPRWPSARPPRCPWTPRCSTSCWAAPSCASCWTPRSSRPPSCSCSAWPRTAACAGWRARRTCCACSDP